jgi:hypothetical protein
MLLDSPYVDTLAKRIFLKYFHAENRLWSHAPPLSVIYKNLLAQSPSGDALSKKKYILFKPNMMENLERAYLKTSVFYTALMNDEQMDELFKDRLIFSEKETARIQKMISTLKEKE